MTYRGPLLRLATFAALALLGACSAPEQGDDGTRAPAEYFGTLEPFAAESVYFIVTDRFVDGDPANNREDQGGVERGTFDRPIQIEGKAPANVGYLGGDFRGVLDNAAYIADMGFSAIWLTPIVDNPDEAFTGGAPPGAGGSNDLGKTGYHGYWGVNFFAMDEHLESDGLSYADLTQQLQNDHKLKTVLDIVVNHGSPAFSMPVDQPKFGELYDAEGRLIADHQNLLPADLDDSNPLHAFYRRERDLAELSDMDYDNPDVLEYFVAAHSHWIGQGAVAVRIDTIKHMPVSFWKKFADRIRALHPDLFMFAEAWSYDADVIAPFTFTENGGISVLDFPGQKAMSQVFGKAGGSYKDLERYLQLETGLYENPYALMTFYDNHDMARMDADANGFIDANNWLFTSRGIPVVYYGSEVGFRAGAGEHAGNRDYFGQENVDQAGTHLVRNALARIAKIRRASIALQRGLQANIVLLDDVAAFLRVYEMDGVHQSALVLLNKGDQSIDFAVTRWVNKGVWRDAETGALFNVTDTAPQISTVVAAHGVKVLLFDAPVNNAALAAELSRLQKLRLRR